MKTIYLDSEVAKFLEQCNKMKHYHGKQIKLTDGQIKAFKEEIGVYKLEQSYQVQIKSRFLLTQTYLKQQLGIGYEVTSVEKLKDVEAPVIDVDSAALAIIMTGYRALARAFHPDLGGDIEKMKLLNQTKKELVDLVKSLGE